MTASARTARLRRLLGVIAGAPRGVPVAVLLGWSVRELQVRSGTAAEYLRDLRIAGFVTCAYGRYRATESGREFLEVPAPGGGP